MAKLSLTSKIIIGIVIATAIYLLFFDKKKETKTIVEEDNDSCSGCGKGLQEEHETPDNSTPVEESSFSYATIGIPNLTNVSMR